MNEPLPLLIEAERAIMLDDIARVGLAVGAGANDLDVSGGSLRAAHCPVERLGFITRILPELAAAQEAIRRSPILTAQPLTRAVTPPIRAQRVSPQAVMTAVRRGEAERRLEERYTVQSADTPENRVVLSFLACLRRDSNAIARMAEAADEAEISEQSARAARQLGGLLADPFWTDITRLPDVWTCPPSERMQAHPAYAPVATRITQYQKAFQFDWAHPLFSLPAREWWQIYEVWTLFQTLEVLQMLGYHAQSHTLWAVRENRLWLRLETGRPSQVRLTHPHAPALALAYNETFTAGERSLSHTMRPDITLTEDEGRLWILDAKFKAYDLPGEEGEDTNQMHGYRDGIVGVHGHRTVAHAWCLFPGRAIGRQEVSYAGNQVGALRLRPGVPSDVTRLREQLAGWIMPEQPPLSSVIPAPPQLPQTQ